MSKEYPEVSSVGGYPIMYVGDGVVYCGECAEKEEKDNKNVKLVAEPHMEGAPVACEECGKEIESAYGDPEE